MEERNNSELDNLFQSRLNDLEGDEASWNIPSDSVFDRALDMMDNREKQRKKVLILWIGGVAATALILGLSFWNFYMVRLVDQKVGQLEVDQQEIRDDLVKDGNKGGTDRIPGIKMQDGPMTGLEVIRPEDESGKKPKNIEQTNQPVAGKKTMRQNWSERETLVNALARPLKQPLTIPNPMANQLFITDRLEPQVEMREASIKTWEVVGNIGPGISTLRMNGAVSPAVRLTRYDDWYPGFQAGLKLRNQFRPGWRVSGSLNYEVINNRSNFTSNHSYNKANETTNPDGSREYNTDMEVMSPVDQHSEHFRMAVGQNQIVNNETLTNTTDFNDHFKYLQVGLGLSKTAIELGNLSLGVSTKLGANVLVGFSEEIDSKMYYGMDMLGQSQHINRSAGDLRRLFLVGGVGVDLEYILSNRFTVGLSLMHDWSLQPMQDVSGVSLDMNKAGASVTIGRRL